MGKITVKKTDSPGTPPEGYESIFISSTGQPKKINSSGTQSALAGDIIYDTEGNIQLPSLLEEDNNPLNPALHYRNVYNEGGFAAFLELGQSNMEGRNGDTTNPDYPFTSLNGSLAWNPGGSNTVALTTTRGGATGGSHANYFADRLFALTGIKSLMIEAAAGGSGLGALSMSSGTNHWGSDGTLRSAAETLATNALTFASITKLSGILWCQGETDALKFDSDTGYTYDEGLTQMRAVIDWMRSTYPGVPIYISETGDEDPVLNSRGWRWIRAIQNQVSQEYSDVFVAFNGAKNFTLESKMVDNLHYNFEGYQAMGEAWAEFIYKHQSGLAYHDESQWNKVIDERNFPLEKANQFFGTEIFLNNLKGNFYGNGGAISGAITIDLDNLVLGATARIIHNDSTNPLPAGVSILSGEYINSENNYIWMCVTDDSKDSPIIEATISQPTVTT